MQLQNHSKLYLHNTGFSNRSLAEEDHQQKTSDASSSKNDKEHSPWLGTNEGLVSKQVIYNEITKQQAKYNQHITTTDIYNTEILHKYTTNYLHQANEVNGRDTVFIRCVCVCVCAAGQSIRPV